VQVICLKNGIKALAQTLKMKALTLTKVSLMQEALAEFITK